MHVPVHPVEEGGGDGLDDQDDLDDLDEISFQVRVVDGQTSIAPVLMRYQRGCQQVSDQRWSFSKWASGHIGFGSIVRQSLLSERSLGLSLGQQPKIFVFKAIQLVSLFLGKAQSCFATTNGFCSDSLIPRSKVSKSDSSCHRSCQVVWKS